jgi:PAS domain S-box-containing protein
MEFYRDAFDHLLEGCQILSPEWRYLYINDIAVHHARKSRQELIGQTLPDLYPGVVDTPMFSMLEQCLRERQSTRLTSEFTYEDGSKAWFELSAEPVPEGVLVLSIDITDRKRDAALIRRLSRTQRVLSNVNQAIVRIRDLGELFVRACDIAVNDGGFAMAWVGLADDSGTHIVPIASAGKTADYLDVFTAPDGARASSCAIFNAVSEGAHHLCMVPARSPDLPCRAVAYAQGFRSLASFPLVLSGKVRGTINFGSPEPDFFDADELKLLDELALDLSFAMEFAEKENLRKEAETLLRENEEKFRKAFYLSPDSINVNRLSDGEYISVNQGFTRIMGYTEEELLGKSSLAVNIWANPDDRERLVAGLSANGIVENLAADFISKRGDRLHGLMSAAIIEFNGTPAILSVTRDITEKQQLLDHLGRAQKLDSLGILAGGIAHDFNNLLSGIFGYIEIAKQHCDSGDPAGYYLEKALEVFRRAGDLTNQLLTFAKGDLPSRKPTALGPIITKCATFSLSGSKVSAEFRIADDLALCEVDEGQIGQVIDNLVINALQAMPMGGTIAISASNFEGIPHPTLPGGRYVRITVADQGIGIPSDIVPRIFDPFFTTKQRGSGLGLSTCYSIIKKHEGTIEVASEPGKGTTFTIFIPASRARIAPAPDAPPKEHHGSGRVLIMDDQEFFLDVASQMFIAMGYAVTTSREGNEALAQFSKARAEGAPFRCAFLDLTIPGGPGGREVLTGIRKIDPDMPVFASSGYSDDPIMSQPREFGFTDSIRKPFRAADLADLMERHFGGRSAD